MAFLSLREVIALRIWGMRPEMLAALTLLMDRADKDLGIKTAVRKYGGYRGPGVQAELRAWRDEADKRDGIIGGGHDYYAVGAPGTSYHEFGSAGDLLIVAEHQRTDANYRKLADLSRTLGLVPGYYFQKKDEFHFQLREPVDEARSKWRAMIQSRVAIAAVGVVGLFLAVSPVSFRS